MSHAKLIQAMTGYEKGHPKRVHHFMVVHGFAKTIGELEQLDTETQSILEIAAIVHDIGIKKSIEIYGDENGKHQEELGPDEARPILQGLGYAPSLTDRVCFLISRHHTYAGVDGMDWQILLEADFLINAASGQFGKEAITKFHDEIFVTGSGKRLLEAMYL